MEESGALMFLENVGEAASYGGSAFVIINFLINIALSGSLNLLWGMVQTENEEPQPHVAVAFGLFTINCEPCRPSL